MKEEKALRIKYDDLSKESHKNKFVKENGVKGCDHRYSNHVQPDPMHTITDVCQNILEWLCGNKDPKKLLDLSCKSKSQSYAKMQSHP